VRAFCSQNAFDACIQEDEVPPRHELMVRGQLGVFFSRCRWLALVPCVAVVCAPGRWPWSNPLIFHIVQHSPPPRMVFGEQEPILGPRVNVSVGLRERPTRVNTDEQPMMAYAGHAI
jgi:hypothetical protein